MFGRCCRLSVAACLCESVQLDLHLEQKLLLLLLLGERLVQVATRHEQLGLELAVGLAQTLDLFLLFGEDLLVAL